MSRTHFGVTADGLDVDMIELRNKNGVVVKCISYGCRITNILLPSPQGSADIVLGFDKLSEYEADATWQGAFVGRYANRIAGAAFTLGGKDYALMKNEGGNYLHGSLEKRVFAVEEADDMSVKFKTVSKDGEEGFPGELEITVIYSLDDDNRLTIEHFAKTSADTHINFTNHSYFDLSCGRDGTIEKHIMRIESDSILETTDDYIPTVVLSVEGTPFDFRTKKSIGRDIGADEKNLKIMGGYDHNYNLRQGGKGELIFAAEVTSQEGERGIKVFTTLPAIQFYTSNHLDGTKSGKGRTFIKRAAFTLETQDYPDAPNRPDFPSTLLRRGEEYHNTTVFEFSF